MHLNWSAPKPYAIETGIRLDIAAPARLCPVTRSPKLYQHRRSDKVGEAQSVLSQHADSIEFYVLYGEKKSTHMASVSMKDDELAHSQLHYLSRSIGDGLEKPCCTAGTAHISKEERMHGKGLQRLAAVSQRTFDANKNAFSSWGFTSSGARVPSGCSSTSGVGYDRGRSHDLLECPHLARNPPAHSRKSTRPSAYSSTHSALALRGDVVLACQNTCSNNTDLSGVGAYIGGSYGHRSSNSCSIVSGRGFAFSGSRCRGSGSSNSSSGGGRGGGGRHDTGRGGGVGGFGRGGWAGAGAWGGRDPWAFPQPPLTTLVMRHAHTPVLNPAHRLAARSSSTRASSHAASPQPTGFAPIGVRQELEVCLQCATLGGGPACALRYACVSCPLDTPCCCTRAFPTRYRCCWDARRVSHSARLLNPRPPCTNGISG